MRSAKSMYDVAEPESESPLYMYMRLFGGM